MRPSIYDRRGTRILVLKLTELNTRASFLRSIQMKMVFVFIVNFFNRHFCQLKEKLHVASKMRYEFETIDENFAQALFWLLIQTFFLIYLLSCTKFIYYFWSYYTVQTENNFLQARERG